MFIFSAIRIPVSRAIHAPPSRLALWAAVGLTALALLGCGPDRSAELAPVAHKIDEPLADFPQVLTLDTSNLGCSPALDLRINPGNITQTATGLLLEGSVFADSIAHGPLRFMNGVYSAPEDIAGIIQGIEGEGMLILPPVGGLSGLSFSPVRAQVTIQQGSDLVASDIPVPDDATCYFVFELLYGGGDFMGETSLYSFVGGDSATVVLDPTDPLFYFTGSMDEGKEAKIPGIKEAFEVDQLAVGVSAGGRFQPQTATSPVLTGAGWGAHIIFGTGFAVPDTPFTVSGNVMLRLPDFDLPDPQVDFLVEGSVFLSTIEDIADPAGTAVSVASEYFPLGPVADIVEELGDLAHLGDGSFLTEYKMELKGETFVRLPSFRAEFLTQGADTLAKVAAITPQQVQNVLDMSNSSSIGGFLDTNPGQYGLGYTMDTQIKLFSVFNSSNHYFAGTDAPYFEWRITNSLSFGPFAFSTDGLINASGSFRIRSTSWLGGGLTIDFDFADVIPDCCRQRFSVDFDATLELGYPSPIYRGEYEATGCFGSLGCDSFGASVSLNDSSVCATMVGRNVCVP